MGQQDTHNPDIEVPQHISYAVGLENFRSLEIPLGLLVSLSLTNDYLPSYVGYVGVVLIVTSSVVTQATIEDEDRKNNANNLYETV